VTPAFLQDALAFAPALLPAAAASCLPLRGGRWIGLAVLAAGLGLAPYLSAAMPFVSFTLIQLCALRLLAPNSLLRIASPALAALVLTASVLYLLTLGIGPCDPYDLGFQARPLLMALALAGLILALSGEGAALALLAGDLLAYAAGLYANLWDALLDPLLVVLAIGVLAARLAPVAVEKS
jgi:hypothetical protein